MIQAATTAASSSAKRRRCVSPVRKRTIPSHRIRGSMRVPFASFATHKRMVRALPYSDNECGGGIALARLTCALRVVGSAYLRLVCLARLLIAATAYGSCRTDNHQAAGRFREPHV